MAKTEEPNSVSGGEGRLHGGSNLDMKGKAKGTENGHGQNIPERSGKCKGWKVEASLLCKEKQGSRCGWWRRGREKSGGVTAAKSLGATEVLVKT